MYTVVQIWPVQESSTTLGFYKGPGQGARREAGENPRNIHLYFACVHDC